MHASYNPKLNLVEEVFGKIDSTMLKMQRADAKNGKPWPEKGAGKETFWKEKLEEAVHKVKYDKEFFQRQYAGFKGRGKAFIKSRGKRLRTSKY